MHCGECGFSVTAEHKRNRYGSLYTYYHCSKRRHDYHCKQPVLSAENLEVQFIEFLNRLTLPDSLHNWAITHLEQEKQGKTQMLEAARLSLLHAAKSVESQVANLTSLRLRDLLTDEEYTKTRATLLQERQRISQTQSDSRNGESWFEPAQLLISFSSTMASRFAEGDAATKRIIIEIVGSNLTLTDKKLSIEARKPFRMKEKNDHNTNWCTYLEEVRILIETGNSEIQSIIAGIRKLDIHN